MKLCVSFSGGKTSGYMARWCQQNARELGYTEVIYVFANTGREHEATLDFVHRCDREWGLGVIWLEAEVMHGQKLGAEHRVVDYDSAARGGEPFEQVIRKYGIPNKSYPHCTRELKLNPIRSYLKRLGWWGEHHMAVGIRVDEIDRMQADAREKRIVAGEQVASKAGRSWLAGVRADLEALGYGVGGADLCAAGVGAPHIRQRLYWLADAGRERDERGGRLEEARGADREAEGEGHQRERSRPDAGGGGKRGGVGHAEQPGLEGHPRHELHGHEPGRHDPHADRPAPEASGDCWVARGEAGRRGEVDSVVRGGDEGVRTEGRERPEYGGSPWESAIYIPCADGKARRIEPGLEPLVDGLPAGMGSDSPGEASPFRPLYDAKGRPIGQAPWRIGMVRGYGNAIVPQLAAEFLKAYLETMEEVA